MIDLNPHHLETVRRILAEHVPACEVRAFGSRATWTAKDYSDLDLAIVGAGPLHRGALGRLKDAFEDSDLPIRVDVLDWYAISESFRNAIAQDCVVVQEGAAKEWKSARWGDLATLEYGKALRGYDSLGGEFKVYGTNGPIGWHDQPLCTLPSVIIGRKGAYRGIHYSPKPFFVIDTAFYLRPVVELDMRWAYYQLLTQDINGLDSGSAIPSTSREDFYALAVSVPPLSEQRAISHVLGTLDDKIELNRRMCETLEAMARALFQSWFVDFEPVRAKMEGRWRSGESLPGLPAEHYHFFPDTLVPSPLGDIPEGWEMCGLGEVVEIYDSKRIPLNSRQRAERQGPYPYYGAAGIMDVVDDYLFDGVYVLIGEDGSVVDDEGYPVVQYVWGQFWVNNHAHVLRAKHSVGLEQLYLFLKQTNIVPYVTGAVQPKLSQTNLFTIPFLLPTQGVCEAFADMAGSLFIQVRSQADESRALAAQRDVLLPRLVSGEVRL